MRACGRGKAMTWHERKPRQREEREERSITRSSERMRWRRRSASWRDWRHRKLAYTCEEDQGGKMTVRDAFNSALDEEMSADPSVFLWEKRLESIKVHRRFVKILRINVFALICRLRKHDHIGTLTAFSFYPQASFTGISVGAAYQGLRPVIEFMTFNFSMQQLVSARQVLCLDRSRRPGRLLLLLGVDKYRVIKPRGQHQGAASRRAHHRRPRHGRRLRGLWRCLGCLAPPESEGSVRDAGGWDVAEQLDGDELVAPPPLSRAGIASPSSSPLLPVALQHHGARISGR
uniref:Pyruvate dehydrogenase E1 component subunit beta n=1 Tax=Zea mays TaxID=4577 RepID=A0A804MGN2_MAIZE